MPAPSMHLLRHIPIPPDSAFRPFADDEIEQSIGRRFERQVDAYADRLAVAWAAGRYSYSTLNATANRLARTILARRGDAAEPVALLFAHGGDALAAILATLKAGKFYVVLDPRHPEERLRYMLEDSGAKLVIADAAHRAYAQRLSGVAIELIDFAGLDPGVSDANLDVTPAPESLATILYTSGSTGRPKGVLHSHRSILVDARNVTNGCRADARDRWLLYAPLSFANSVRTIYGALLNGGALFPFDLKQRGFRELTAWLRDNEITILRGLPTFFRSFMTTVDERERFPAVRVLAIGGESMLQADLDYFNRHFLPHCVLLHGFGPSECLSTSWALVPHGEPAADGKLPIGYTLPDKEVLLLDEAHRVVRDGEVGEIAVRSRYLSPGYWRDPEQTRAAFLPDPNGGEARIYLTGDFGQRAPDGSLVHLGRQDFQVKIRGYRVDVSEVENALRGIAGVSDAVVGGREIHPGEQKLIAWYVASTQPPIAASALREALASKLPDHLIPSLFVAIDAIPQTPNGKTDRRGLPLPQRERRDADARSPAPVSALEAEVGVIWAGVLGLDHVEPDDRFLDLGGDSLQAAAITARVVTRFDVEVSPSALLDAGTVAHMASVVAKLLHRREVNP
jgi:amino acid adenylation domain-containing protein